MKYKTYPKMKESGVEWIGEIPELWKVGQLRFFGKFISGTGFPHEFQGEESGDYPFFKVSDTNKEGNKIHMSFSENWISKKNKNELKAKIAPKHSIIFPKIGAALLKNKRRILTMDSVFDNNMMAFNPHSNETNFWYYFFLLIDFKEIVNPGPVPSLGDEKLKEFKIIIPTIKEQQIISDFLNTEISKIDFEILKNQKLLKLLKENKQVITNYSIFRGLDPSPKLKDSGIKWIGKIPQYWELNYLKNLSTKIGDGIHSTPEYLDNTEYHFINGNNLIDGYIKLNENTGTVSEDEYKKYKLNLNEKTILLSINGTIGNTSFFNNEKIVLGKSACYINCNKKLHVNYLFYLLNSLSVQNYFDLEKTGTTIFNLSLESIRNMIIPLPPYDEQKNITDFLTKFYKKIDSLILKNLCQINNLQKYKNSLIFSTITGKICVTN